MICSSCCFVTYLFANIVVFASMDIAVNVTAVLMLLNDIVVATL